MTNTPNATEAGRVHGDYYSVKVYDAAGQYAVAECAGCDWREIADNVLEGAAKGRKHLADEH